jgi:hypothetical protein
VLIKWNEKNIRLIQDRKWEEEEEDQGVVVHDFISLFDY